MWSTLAHRAKPNKKLGLTHRVTTLKYKAYESKRIQYCVDRAKIALDMIGVHNVGPIPLPRRRRLVNVLKSPFKWKKHQELWEKRTFSRIISFEADVKTTKEILDYLYRSKYEGIGLRTKRLSFEPLEKYWKHPYLHTVELNRSKRVADLRRSKKIQRPALKNMKTPIKGKIWHINADSEVVDLTSQIAVSKPSLEELAEPEVVTEELLYNDDSYKFAENKFKKFDALAQDRLTNLVSLCREKITGPHLDKDTWRSIVNKMKEDVMAKNEIKEKQMNE